MVERIARWQPDQSAAVTARAIGALALVALAVIHVVDLPGTLGPTPLVGIGYLGIISGAVLIGGQQNLERRSLGDLRIELPARAKTQHGFVAGLLFEGGRDLLGRIGEVRCDRNIGLCSVSLPSGQAGGKQADGGRQHFRGSHGFLPMFSRWR